MQNENDIRHQQLQPLWYVSFQNFFLWSLMMVVGPLKHISAKISSSIYFAAEASVSDQISAIETALTQKSHHLIQ